MSEVICGRHSVNEAIRSNIKISKIYTIRGDETLKKIIFLAEKNNIPIEYVDRNFIEKTAFKKSNQGIAAIVEDYRYSSLNDILALASDKNEKPFLLILDGICDPHNLGAIIRTANAAGVHGIVLTKNRCAGVNQTVNKASAGAIVYMKIARVTNIINTISQLKKQDIWVYGADACSESVVYCKQNLTGGIAVVLGSEGKGISRLVRENCDGLIHIPMFGEISSLNVSVAAGILCYEILGQRGSFTS